MPLTRTTGHYPALDPAVLSEIARRQVEIIALSHPEGLTNAQREEMAGNVTAQLAATERLHRFELGNADEPAFVMPAGPRETR